VDRQGDQRLRGGQVFAVAVVFELCDGKIWRDTRYYAEPFEAILADRRRLGQMLGVTAFDFPGVAGLDTMRFVYEYLRANSEALG
jgi:hypothetical protein